ncbi:MAG: CBS domain-containing protein [Bdellovibrio sp.]
MKTQNRNLMTKNLITAPLDMNLKDAAFLMRTQNIRHLPVVDENDGIVGIFSSKNFPLLGDPTQMTLEFFMSSPAIYVSEDASIKEAIYKMLENKISSVLVADKDEDAVGIITTEDLLKFLLVYLENEPVEAKSYFNKILDMQTLGQLAQQISQTGI